MIVEDRVARHLFRSQPVVGPYVVLITLNATIAWAMYTTLRSVAVRQPAGPVNALATVAVILAVVYPILLVAKTAILAVVLQNGAVILGGRLAYLAAASALLLAEPVLLAQGAATLLVYLLRGDALAARGGMNVVWGIGAFVDQGHFLRALDPYPDVFHLVWISVLSRLIIRVSGASRRMAFALAATAWAVVVVVAAVRVVAR